MKITIETNNPDIPLYKVIRLIHKYCDGKGIDYISSPMGVKCKGCNSGYVSLRIKSDVTLVKHSRCNGTGVDRQNSLIGVECQPCHGTGLVPKKILTY